MTTGKATGRKQILTHLLAVSAKGKDNFEKIEHRIISAEISIG